MGIEWKVVNTTVKPGQLICIHMSSNDIWHLFQCPQRWKNWSYSWILSLVLQRDGVRGVCCVMWACEALLTSETMTMKTMKLFKGHTNKMILTH